jgi:hypothetical protein
MKRRLCLFTIYMRITVNGVSKETTISRKCVQIAGAQNPTDAYYLFKLSGFYKFLNLLVIDYDQRNCEEGICRHFTITMNRCVLNHNASSTKYNIDS